MFTFDIYMAIFSAFWLGVLTSVSPCPLTTNIAAVSFIARKISSPKLVFCAGVIYISGRVIAYTVLGLILAEGIISSPVLSHWLQKYMNLFIGPLLIIIAMILLNLIKINIFSSGISSRFQNLAKSSGIWGAGLLGIIFALSFCPVSAALFFGSLLPLSIKFDSAFLLPAVYGIATGIPAVLFALVAALGTNKAAAIYQRMAFFEKYASRLTGIIFLLAGIYLSLTLSMGLKFF